MQEDTKPSVKERFKSGRRRYKTFAMGAALGVIVGAVIGLLKAPKKGEELEEELKEKFKGLSDKFDTLKERFEPKLKQIFGNLGEETHEVYHELKTEIVKRCAEYSGDLEEGEYNKIIDSVVEDFQKDKIHLKEKLSKLGDEFKDSWGDLKELFNEENQSK